VSISVSFANGNLIPVIPPGPPAPAQLTAYLTNSLGPGTTSANEIARTDITLTNPYPTTATLFSGLNLPAGTYFLVVGGTTGGQWLTSQTGPAIASGVGFIGAYRIPGLGYIPARVFSKLTGEYPIFQITGTPDPVPYILSQIVDGSGWKTTFILANLDSVPAHFTLRFWSDRGDPLPLLSLAAIGNQLSEFSNTIPVGGVQFIETAGSATELSQGWAELISSNRMGGAGIFRQQVSGRPDFEASVPLATAVNATLSMPFDNTNGFVTGVALVNTDTRVAGKIEARVRDESGVEIFVTLLDLPARGHLAFATSDLLKASAGHPGVIDFRQFGSSTDPPTMAILGLRFNPSGAFASVTPLF